MADAATTLIGNLTRDPELKFTQSGRAVANFSLAVSRRWQSNGEWQEETSFFDVTAWGTLGENAASSVEKGNRVIVVGRLEQQRWEQDGNNRSKVVVVADSIGPDLRWATAEISKVERSSDTGAPASAGSKATSKPQKQEQSWDEEPF